MTTDRGENFVDTSSLPPMIAFERIEILKDGATALYGSEAVAGVANFITRSNFVGFDLELGLQGNDGIRSSDAEISGVWGGGEGDTRTCSSRSTTSTASRSRPTSAASRARPTT